MMRAEAGLKISARVRTGTIDREKGSGVGMLKLREVMYKLEYPPEQRYVHPSLRSTCRFQGVLLRV